MEDDVYYLFYVLFNEENAERRMEERNFFRRGRCSKAATNVVILAGSFRAASGDWQDEEAEEKEEYVCVFTLF